ncbi:MAG TPA: tetratricopeptide repeat protein, partial [Nitrososphaerales archaeon]|nr:tetratricopeptide repeat protein [Nitrososphaerales archaeon]
LGDVVHKDGDVFGDAVNISSRIQPTADPGGVCISRQVYDQVHNKFELPIVSIGERKLKNVNGAEEVYRVVMPWEGKPEQAQRGAEPRRVAVLPFSNLSPDPADEYFADGMTEELISTVSRIDGTEVISRTSVMQYKKSPKPIRQISGELDAGTVLEGSIRKAGNKLRVSVQMIDAVKDRHLWAESYDRNLDDVFAIQSDIASRVAEALRARMAKESPRSVGETDNIEAYTAFLRAKQLLNEGTRTQISDAVGLLQDAVAKDPNFSRAYSELARALRHQGMFGDYIATMKKAEEVATRAIETAPESAEAHAAMGSVHSALDRFEAAQAEVETAISLNPNLSEALHLLGEINGAFGRLDEAVANQRKAYALDPVSLYAGTMLSDTLRAAGRVDEAMQVLTRMKELYPNNHFVAQAMSACYILRKDFQKAREVLEASLAAEPENRELRINLGYLAALEGRRDEALEELQKVEGEKTTLRSNARLFINTALGRFDDAFAALDELARTHAWPFLIRSEPQLESLRKDPRFSEFCRKVGIPP